MKKLIAMLLAVTMLSVPVYGEDNGYTQEELILRAKEICDIGDYADFEVLGTSTVDGVTRYRFKWYDEENDNSEIVSIDSNGVIYSYSENNEEKVSKAKVYSDTEAKVKADEFLNNALQSNTDKPVYKECSNYKDTYSFCYNMTKDEIEIKGAYIYVDVNKYTNEITEYNHEARLAYLTVNSFDGARSVDEAETAMKESFKAKYIVMRNSDGENEVKLLYYPEKPSIDAFNLNFIDEYDLDEAGGGGSASQKNEALTKAEEEALVKLNKAVSADKAVEICNNVIGTDIRIADGISCEYVKENQNTDTYFVRISQTKNGIYRGFNVDSKGRLIYYISYGADEENKSERVDKAVAKTNIESIINKAVSADYELSPLEISDGYDNRYILECNVIRNGYISMNEGIYAETDAEGNISYFSVDYYDDEFKNIVTKAEITGEEAFNNAKEKLGFKPYQAIRENYDKNTDRRSYDTVPVYAFGQEFSVDAVTGEVLDYYGNKMKEEIVIYTDINNQWYAEAAKYLMYMGYGFEGDEFKGEEALTYEAMTDLYDSLEITDEEIAPDTVITRYDFGKRLVKAMGYEDLSRYNEIYIKPFDDVDFEYTGVVAILKAKGILTSESYRGNDPITRGEAAVMLYRYLSSK